MNEESNKRVFISHGHNRETLLELRTFIRESLEFTPIVLSEQPDEGLTIVEKLEKYARDCQFAIVLLTGDDETKAGGYRARQNVVHELGFFHGLLGRARVLLCKEIGTELFSNISGLIYKEFEPGRIHELFEDIRQALSEQSAEHIGRTVPQQDETKSLTSIFFSMADTLRQNIANEIISEIRICEEAELNYAEMEKRIEPISK